MWTTKVIETAYYARLLGVHCANKMGTVITQRLPRATRVVNSGWKTVTTMILVVEIPVVVVATTIITGASEKLDPGSEDSKMITVIIIGGRSILVVKCFPA